MTADDFARQYIEIGGSPYKELVEVIQSAMDYASNRTTLEPIDFNSLPGFNEAVWNTPIPELDYSVLNVQEIT